VAFSKLIIQLAGVSLRGLAVEFFSQHSSLSLQIRIEVSGESGKKDVKHLGFGCHLLSNLKIELLLQTTFFISTKQ
jgi:hypothetical protein